MSPPSPRFQAIARPAFAIAAVAASLGMTPDPARADDTKPMKVIIRYHRHDGDYENADLWTWDGRKKKDPAKPNLPFTGKDDYGIYWELDPTQYGPDDTPADSIGFIPRPKSSWDFKDGNDRFWTPELGNEIWLIGNDPNIYRQRPDTSPKILGAFLDAGNRVTALLSHRKPSDEITAASFSLSGVEAKILSATPKDGKAKKAIEFELLLDRDLDPAVTGVRLTLEGYGQVAIVPRDILFDQSRYYSPDWMGTSYAPSATTFRVFSPLAEAVALCLYDEAKGDAGRREVALAKSPTGVWEAKVDGDLEGKFYAYKVTLHGKTSAEVYDPNASCTQGASRRPMITDPRKADPEGFRPVQRPTFGPPTDAVIYEISVRDFSMDPDSGISDHGKYLGFVEKGTHLASDPTIATGIDHLKELGVTHVQLLPMQDFDNGDEDTKTYNWGYMTAFFNTPDGWFATSPEGARRIKEFKTAVQALHAAGIRVVMDVVYNHTAPSNTFEAFAPGYFHRTRADGSFWNGSGTGNEFRSEAPMARRFLINSLKYWVEEYGVDGFRFDLLGLTDMETIQQLEKELHAIEPSLLIYGEPWAASKSGLQHLSDKGALKGKIVGAFNDNFRNGIKGEPDGANPGYVQNGSRRDDVIKGIKGGIDDWTADPTQAINYVTCHDNLTLWDKIQFSSKEPKEERMKMYLMSIGILATSQGAMFIHGGEEIVRTKGGEHNSYNKGDEINQLDWKNKKEFPEAFKYFQGAIALRKAHPLFRLATAKEVRDRITMHTKDLPVKEAISFSIDGKGLKGEDWKEAVVLYNPNPAPQEFKLPRGKFDIFALGDKFDTKAQGHAEKTLTVPGRSVAVLGRD